MALPAVGAAALALAASAAAGVDIAGVDTSGYPQVRVTVIAPVGSGSPRLEENGVAVAGIEATNLGSVKSVALAVDRSQSMTGASLADATAAARDFVAAKSGADQVEVIAFGHRAVALTRFSSSTNPSYGALAQLRADPAKGTALWDAVVLAARGFAHAGAPGNVIIVVTDGRDVSSSASFDEAVAAAHHARAAVYAIGIGGPQFTPGPLQALSADTGGTYHQASSSSELAAVYASIGSTLQRTWQLQYSTAARPGDVLRLTAAVPGAGTGARTVALPAGTDSSSVTPPSSVLPASAWGSRLASLAVAGGVGLLVLLAAGFALAARRGDWLSTRLAPHLGPVERRKTRRRRDGRALLHGLFAATEQTFANVKQFRALQRLLTRADLPLLAAELLYVCVGTGLAAGLLTLLAGAPTLPALILMAAGAVCPVLFVSFKAGRRIKAFDDQLPDLLITIAASLKAGHSFRHAIQAVVEEGAEPAAKEFRRVLTETRLGRPMDDALTELSERIGSKNFSFVVTSVTIQRQIGGSLAGLFDMVAETVRQRQQFARKVRSLTAMGRMSAYVLVALPFCVALVTTVISPLYMSPLWNTRNGHDLIAAGLVMLVIGSLFLRKIISFRG